MTGGVYQIRCQITGKRYVGSATVFHRRWSLHKFFLRKGAHHSLKLQRAWKKYGEEAFVFEVLENCEKKDLLLKEQYWIDALSSFCNGYNCTGKAVSNLGKIWTAAQKRRHSVIAKKVASRPGESELRSKRAKKQHLEGRLGRSSWGPQNLQEVGKKISSSLRGRKLSPEHREALSRAQLKRFQDPVQRVLRSKAAKLGFLRKKSQ